MKKVAVIFSVCLILGLAAPIYAQDYNGHHYELIEDNLTWDDASNAAAGMFYNGIQGHLATITTLGEHEFIDSEWGGYIYDEGRGVWIGGTDEADEGNWDWITLEPWAFTYWNDDEPNGGSDENCLEYQDVLYWNDVDCGNEQWYLVEYDSTAVPTMNEWGMIIFMAFAGLGSIYYLRKKKKV